MANPEIILGDEGSFTPEGEERLYESGALPRPGTEGKLYTTEEVAEALGIEWPPQAAE